MQLNLPSFNREKSTKTRIQESIASGLKIKGLDNMTDFTDLLKEIFVNYELEKGVFKLKDEHCEHCKQKLKRKGVYQKEVFLPGGARIFLSFHQYSCRSCKKKVDRHLGEWFHQGERYSSNVKSDAVRMYLSHLSSYDAVHKELIKLYGIKQLSKRTVRLWISKAGILSSEILASEKDFSGHFIYDEEYMKVFLGDVGKKGAKLSRVEVYLLLFRDAITHNLVIMLSDSLERDILTKHWTSFAKWTMKKGIEWKTLATDGKKEYDCLVREINRKFKLHIRHAYCIFHFKGNLYEVCNYHFFGSRTSKKELPEYVINQIKIICNAVDAHSKHEFLKCLRDLKHQINTFIPPLQNQIKRLKNYQKNYSLYKEFPHLRTTNLCEQWFGRTKPEKLKKGYKTKKGLLLIAKSLAVKILYPNWKNMVNLSKDITDATNLLITALNYKVPHLKPA